MLDVFLKLCRKRTKVMSNWITAEGCMELINVLCALEPVALSGRRGPGRYIFLAIWAVCLRKPTDLVDNFEIDGVWESCLERLLAIGAEVFELRAILVCMLGRIVQLDAQCLNDLVNQFVLGFWVEYLEPFTDQFLANLDRILHPDDSGEDTGIVETYSGILKAVEAIVGEDPFHNLAQYLET
jgi:hypothetical protein